MSANPTIPAPTPARGRRQRRRAAAALVALALTVGVGADDCNQSYEPARYPIVLAHGFSGFDSLLGIPYFYGIESELTARGNELCVTEVSAYNTVEVRGTQLAAQVEDCLAFWGADKVHLVGHSMGGLDVRYATSLILGADKVASVTTIASPHRGSTIADLTVIALDVAGHIPGAEILNFLLSELGGAIVNGDLVLPQDVELAIRNLTSDFAEEFNQVVLDEPGVLYQSYTGTKQVSLLDLDPSDLVLAAMSTVVFPFEPDDGLVSQSSAAWGTPVDLQLPANHLDEVNHLLGDTDGFDAVGLYLEIADGLAAQGL